MVELHPLVSKALLFATEAHGTQCRMYTGEPYIVHPIRVMQLLIQHVPDTSVELRCAALLHDVLEDTKVTSDEMRRVFGEDITRIVLQVTSVSKPEDGSRAHQKGLDRDHFEKADVSSQLLMCADLISNIESSFERDTKFSILYYLEVHTILKNMLDVVKEFNIWKIADAQLREHF